MSGPRVTRRRDRGNRGPCGGVLTSKARLGGVRDDCALRAASLTFLLVAGLALALAAGLAACSAPGERPALPATASPAAAEPTAPPAATPPPTVAAPTEATATPSPTPNATATPSPTATPTATATPAAPTPTPTPTADATAAGTPSPTTFRYNILDTTGAATTAGSYAFLTTAGDATSAFDNLGAVPADSVELRIHPADASGTSRAAFYDTVKVGDSFDYRTNGLECGLRFKVTSVATTTTPTFGLEWVFLYGGYCEGLDGMPGAARDVEFVWGVGPGIPDPDGVNALLRNEPAGAGTYRLYEGLALRHRRAQRQAGHTERVLDRQLPCWRPRHLAWQYAEHRHTPHRRRHGLCALHRSGHGRGDQSRYHLTRWRGLVRSDHGVDPDRGVGGRARRVGCE